MVRKLRRAERAMADDEARELLERGEYGVLSTVSAAGEPYGVPLSYSVLDNGIYFHCALEGHKLENLAPGSRVSFCVVGRTEILPDQFATRYESVIVSGMVTEVGGDEKQHALEGLVAKYSPGYQPEGLRYIATDGRRTRVFRIDIDRLSGKRRP